jgi:hypothetical protein
MDDIDPRLKQQLDEVGRAVTTVTRERDALVLDHERDQRQLAAADARNKYHEQLIAVITRQRDFYLGKIVEVVTHAGEVEHHYERMKAAALAVMEMQNMKLPTEPAEPIHDAAAKDVTQEQPAPQVRTEDGKPVFRPQPRPAQPPETYAPPAVRRLAGLER